MKSKKKDRNERYPLIFKTNKNLISYKKEN
jgi:hypothetical protein